MALANLIASRLYDRLREHGASLGQTKVAVLLEEAHKFLGKGVARSSPFGIIAREMRKRGVIVVPIDQKPGELDPDVISMTWTSFVFALTDPKDVETALYGLESHGLYKNIVPSLRQGEALIYGPAIRFPVVLRIRDYGVAAEEFERLYKEYLAGNNLSDGLDGDII